MSRTPEPASFVHDGRRIAYREHGSGDRVIVLTHGLLMDSRMYTALAPALAARGHRVVTVDMLGHGASDHPHDMTVHSMTHYGRDIIALLDHLKIQQAIIGGTSLGANVSLEAAVLAPDRVRGLVLEMPVLENGISAAAAAFVPLALALRTTQPVMRALASLTRRIPRTYWLADLLIDFVRRDPASSLAVLDGLTFGRIAPPVHARRQLQHPTLVIGHISDPIHPFSDADATAHELAGAQLLQARSIYEWRVRPGRLTAALCNFLDHAWAQPRAVAGG